MSFKDKLKSLFSVDDEYEYEYTEEDTDDPEPSINQHQDNTNVVNLTSMKQPTSKVVLCEPRAYNEAQEIADNLVNRRAVVINLERVDHNQAVRIVDFLSGTVYALNGDIQKLGTQTFLCTPDNVKVSGSIAEAYINGDEFGKGW
ncbi:MAG TPA: cell division protein SepF [Virgibacillus sp.]|nr:cell division protein SepF [Virgibacillus sp.]